MTEFFTGGAGAIINTGAGFVNNLFGAWREGKAREENYKYNELAAQNADIRTRALYNDLYSPKAQLEQLKTAGLSPSLFYGDGGGISGQTGAMGAGASGVSPTTFGIDPLQGMQMQLMQAQARNLNAEADQKEGKNAMGQAIISDLLANAGAKEAAASLDRAAEALTKQNTRLAYQSTMKAYYEALDAGLTYEFNQQTFDTRKQIESNKAALLLADIAERESKIKLNEQQVKELETKIGVMCEQIQIDWNNAIANETSAEAWSDFLRAKIPFIEKELELEAERLGIERTRVWVDGGTRVLGSVLTACETAMTLRGQGMQQTTMTTTANYNSKGQLTGYQKSNTEHTKKWR